MTTAAPTKPAAKARRPRLSEEERRALREAKREQAEAALDALLTEDGWATWLRLRRNLHRYSATNQVLIAIQAHQQATAHENGLLASEGWINGAPDTPCDETPTLVKAAWRWKQDGYHPAKGTRALYIWVFKSRRRKDGTFTCCGTPVQKGACPTCGKEDRFFQLGPVFDASQVRGFESGEPPDLQLPPAEAITGDDPGRLLLEPLANWALQEGIAGSITMDAESDHGELGSWNHATRELRICTTTGAPVNQQLRVLIHELAHAKGITSRDGLDLSYAEAEVAVEVVSYIVAATAGLDTGGEAIPYIAGWGGEGAAAKIRALAKLIDETAKILEAPILALLNPDPDPQEQEAS